MTLKSLPKGQKSSIKNLPGGGPQGTLLGLLIFLILINEVGFEGQKNNLGEILTTRKHIKSANLLHLKYVDDLSLADAINLPEKLVANHRWRPWLMALVRGPAGLRNPGQFLIPPPPSVGA